MTHLDPMTYDWRVEAKYNETLDLLLRDRWKLHAFLFPHRHPDKSPRAHREIVRLIYEPNPRQLIEGFRGLAKSTLLEEAAVVKACLHEFKNMIVLSASYTLATERLASIKHELDSNEMVEQVFGKQKGSVWREGKIVLPDNSVIQAIGRDQRMTGTKHLDWRPDAALVDDVEDPEEVRTDAERAQTWRWFITTFLPALDHPVDSWVRVLGTRRGVGSLPERLENEGWPTAKFPIERIGTDGERRATWPAKFPLPVVDEMMRMYRGDMHTWAQEYMCQASSEADRVFRREFFRVQEIPRSWQAVYAMIDPARTTNRTSATTGWAVWSWLGNRLHVWAAGAAMLKPDEIIDLVFTIAHEFNPVLIGIEEDGLNEFLLQPLRQEQVKRGCVVPFRPLRAPRGKLDFLRGLQPFFAAGEVSFNAPLPDLEAQLLSFPSGRIDAPNALAYALTLRPAGAFYDPVPVESIADDVEPDPARPLYLAANATGSLTTAVLVQLVGDEFRIIADYVAEGSPFETVPGIQAAASLEGDAALRRIRAPRYDWTEALKLPVERMALQRRAPTWVVPPHHGDSWNNVGLEQAIRRLPSSATRGTTNDLGRPVLQGYLRAPRDLAVSTRAPWVLRAFAGGYCRGVRKGGALGAEAEAGIYATLMEGLESFAGMMAAIATDESGDDMQPVAYTRSGVPYKSAMPQRR